MKFKHIFITVLAVCVLAAFSVPSMSAGQWSPLFTKKQPGGIYGVINTEMTTGDIWYVDSGSGTDGSGYGQNPMSPCATLDYAIGLCTASNGDVIFVMPGHAENLALADAVDVDVAGVRIVGLGEGNNRPTFTYTATAGEFVIGAANITVENLRFVAGISNVTMGISVEAAGDNFAMINCEVPEPGTATFDFADIIDLASGADNVTIDGLIVRQVGVTAGDLDHCIEMGTGVNNRFTLKNSVIEGEFAVAAIWSDTADTEVLIEDCIITNATNGQHAIEFTSTARGEIRNCLVRTDEQTTACDPGSLTMANVLWDDNDVADSVAVPVVDSADQTDLAAILTDTAAMDTAAELQALAFGSASGGADILADTAAIQPCAPGCVSKTLTTIANGNNDLFVVSGTCKIVEIVGIVSTEIEAKSCLINYNMDPTSPAGDTAFATDGTALEINADAVGTLYTWDGVVANDLTATTNGVAIGMANDTGLVVPAGSIELAAVVATSATGAITFHCR